MIKRREKEWKKYHQTGFSFSVRLTKSKYVKKENTNGCESVSTWPRINDCSAQMPMTHRIRWFIYFRFALSLSHSQALRVQIQCAARDRLSVREVGSTLNWNNKYEIIRAYARSRAHTFI